MHRTVFRHQIVFSIVFSVGFGLQLWPTLGLADPALDSGVPVDECVLANLKGKCRPAPLSAEDNMREERIPIGEVRFSRKLTLPDQPLDKPLGGCDAKFAISYFQAHDRVKVDTLVTNTACPASHGEYSLRIRTTDAQGESLTRTFVEPWSRNQWEEIKLTKYYPMEGAKRLVWVRVKSSRKSARHCDSPPTNQVNIKH